MYGRRGEGYNNGGDLRGIVTRGSECVSGEVRRAESGTEGVLPRRSHYPDVTEFTGSKWGSG